MRLVTSHQMQEMDRYTIESVGIPGIVLMENAARSWVAAAESTLTGAPRVFIFCGAGNNGGDGYAIARILVSQGYSCMVVAVKPAKTVDCRTNADIWLHYGAIISWEEFRLKAFQTARDDIIVDAVLGTGVETEIKGELVAILDAINNLEGIKIAVDMPSGISASTGDFLGVAVKCHRTITFQTEKIGHHLYPGITYTGDLHCQNISIQERFLDKETAFYLINESQVRPKLPDRAPDGYKNVFGHLATWCGTSGTLGASFLASYAGLKTGAGLTTAALPTKDQHTFLALAPELMSYPQEEITLDWLKGFSALVIGCGLGRELAKWEIIASLTRELQIPIIFDADAFYGIQDWRQFSHENLILTPHPGEFAQLSGFTKPKNNHEKIEQGQEFVANFPVTLILKGAPTILFDKDGNVYINSTGNSGMATAGSGDVLAGMVGGLAAQGLSVLDASLLGTWLHGKCGDLFCDDFNEESLTATGLIDYYSKAVNCLRKNRSLIDS